MTTEQMIHSGTNSPPAEISTQQCRIYL